MGDRIFGWISVGGCDRLFPEPQEYTSNFDLDSIIQCLLSLFAELPRKSIANERTGNWYVSGRGLLTWSVMRLLKKRKQSSSL